MSFSTITVILLTMQEYQYYGTKQEKNQKHKQLVKEAFCFPIHQNLYQFYTRCLNIV